MMPYVAQVIVSPSSTWPRTAHRRTSRAWAGPSAPEPPDPARAALAKPITRHNNPLNQKRFTWPFVQYEMWVQGRPSLANPCHATALPPRPPGEGLPSSHAPSVSSTETSPAPDAADRPARRPVKRIGHTLSPTRIPLPQLTGVPVEPAATALRPCDGVRFDRSPTPSAGL